MARPRGRVASSVDNTMIESFWSTMQRELLDTHRWDTKIELSQAIFERIEAWYNPRRRHTSINDLAPAGYEQCAAASDSAAWRSSFTAMYGKTSRGTRPN